MRAIAWLGLLTAVGCGAACDARAPGSEPSPATSGSTVVVTSDSGALAPSTPAEPDSADLAAPFGLWGYADSSVASTTIWRTFDVRVVNETATELVVRVSAGAAEVVAETLQARDSARLRLRAGADSVVLRGADLQGRDRGIRVITAADSAPRVAFP